MDEKLKIVISAEIDKLKQNVNKAKSEINGFSQQVADAKKDVDKNFKAIGKAIGSAMKTAGKAVAAAGTALIGVAAATMDYRKAQAKLSTAFESAGLSAANAKDVFKELYRVMGDTDTATEASQQIALLASSEQSAGQWAEYAAGVVATFGDALQPEAFYEAANETVKLGEATGAYTQMLEQAGLSVEEFNTKMGECSTQAEREAVALEYTEKAVGSAADAYNEANAPIHDYNESMLRLKENLGGIGETMQPIITAFINFGATILELVSPYLAELATVILPPLQAALGAIVGFLEGAINFFVQYPEVLAAAGVALGIITAAVVAYNTVAAIKNLMAVKEVATIGALIAAYAAQAAAMIIAIAPYALAVAAIAAVIAIIVVCIKHWDEIKEACANAWSSIKEKTSEAVANVKQKFSDLKAAATEKVEAMKASVREKFDSIKSAMGEKIEAAKSIVSGKFEAIKSKIEEKINGARDVVKKGIDKIKSFFDFSWDLPKIKLPHFTITGGFSLLPPKAPSFSIDWYANGGVFDKPTLFNYGSGSIGGLGEAGAEAVVPLEKNTKWLDRIADRLAGKQAPIILQVDGKTFGEIAVDSINGITKQTGNLPLRLI